jgi:hypothetical protein
MRRRGGNVVGLSSFAYSNGQIGRRFSCQLLPFPRKVYVWIVPIMTLEW